MNRFRKNKKEKAKEDVEGTESIHSSLGSKLSRKSKKEEPEEVPDLDLSSVLPSNDDFRTSLLMPKLSARFSMLREQDDPASIIGKASDDSVLFPKRASRLNLFGHNPNLLADIDEVSTDGSRPSFNLGRDSFASGVDGYGTDDDRSHKESIMSRARRADGNNLFGGRQKVYKIPAKASSTVSVSDAGKMGGRAVYEHDLSLSAFQRLRLREKEERIAAEEAQQDIYAHESEDALSSISSTKRTTFSSTASGPTANGRTSTSASSIDEQSFPVSPSQESPAPFPKQSVPGMAPERGSVKSRRLYGQSLAQSVQNQQNSTLHRLESLGRQRSGTAEIPRLNRNYSRSATSLRDRIQKLPIAESTTTTLHHTSPAPSSTSTQHTSESNIKEQKPHEAPNGGLPPLSPPASEYDESAALMAALQPEDHGKATALGLFNKPRSQYDENQFSQRQLQMHEGRSTPPPLTRPSPPGRATPQGNTGRPRGLSNTSYRPRAGSASSHYSEAQRPIIPSSAASVYESPRRNMNSTFFANMSPSESEDEEAEAVLQLANGVIEDDFVHPAFRSETPQKPSPAVGEGAQEQSPLPEVRFSDLGDLKPIAENDAAEKSANHVDVIPEKPDSPTLGPSGLGLSGLVRTHLRHDSDKSSIFPPPSPGLPPRLLDDDNNTESLMKGPDTVDPIPQQHATSRQNVDPSELLNGSSWQGELVARHRRQASTETQREREEFENELAERRRKVQEKLKGMAENESRSASPVSGRQTPDYTHVKPGNAFSLLKNKSGKHSLFSRQDQRNPKMLGLGNASTPTLASDDQWREEEERPSFSFGKHSNSSSPHVSSERSIRSRMAAFGRNSQEDSRESSRSRGASPNSSFRSQRDRSTSDASGRSKSRTRRERDDLGTLEEAAPADSYEHSAYPDFDQRGLASVASSTRPSVEVNDASTSVYDRSSSAASGRYRSGSRSGTPSFVERSLHPPPALNPQMIGAPPRPSPIAPYSANATPPLHDMSPDPSSSSASTSTTSLPQRTPGHTTLQKRPVDKNQISEPTFVSTTSNVPTVGLPPGASLSNGMATPPIPPMNPRRRRQTTTQTILGAIRGDKYESQYAPSTAGSVMEEHSTFSDEGERRPRTRNRLRKTSSEGGDLNAKARHQLMASPPPAMPPYPPPQVPMDGLNSGESNSLRRANSSGPSFRIVDPPQVDGSAERRKRKSARKREKKKRKAQWEKATKDKVLPQGSNDVDIGNAQHSSSNHATMSSAKVMDNVSPVIVKGLFGGPRIASWEDTPSSHTVHSLSGKGEVHDEQPQPIPNHVENDPVVCLLHGRKMCQFDLSCCVHRPTINCACPPRWSCCCAHHSGDCCNCVFASGPSDHDEQASKPASDGLNQTQARSIRGTSVVDADAGSIRDSSGYQTIPTEIINNGKTINDDTDPLSAHLLHCLEASEFFDFQIILRSSKDIFMPITFYTHRAVISRSRFVASLLRSSNQEEGCNEIVAIGGESFCMIKSFEYALQHLYGRPLLTAEQLRSTTLSTYGYSEDNVEKLHFSLTAAMADFALSYAASGAFFQQEAVIERGVNLAIDLISWSTVEYILNFGMSVTKFAVTLDRTAPGLKSGNYDAAEGLQGWALRLVISALEFVARHMGKDFPLYIKAQRKTLPNRIPDSLQSIPGTVLRNPKLAEVKFGSLASLDEERPSQEIDIPSAMLICLPYEHLVELFKAMKARDILTRNLAQAVIAEREARRLQALQVFAKQSIKDELNVPDEVRELGYQETVGTKEATSETQNPNITLNKEWVGLPVIEKKLYRRGVKQVAKKNKRRKSVTKE
ncbi:hypothetical protein BDV23DRAFT_183107 [Aspergillus alliaceus]|uniref:BTB domain-containing protein n=1 Tax=Petromyces alliaceus TaxID=209559 RepID=A0A5N7C9H3_PETAA|nr:hypothetical protein BDV23DRAFT_183107 [Aspergillus alliaceus]